jgi:hypothetical protein
VIHLHRYIYALGVLLALCGTYALAVAPWFEPPPLKPHTPSVAQGPIDVPPEAQRDLERLFEPQAWERDPKTKVIVTEQATILIQDYYPTPEGALKLTPCTIIFYAAGQPAAAADGSVPPAKSKAGRRPVVLQAPAGATLEFDRPLDLGRAEFGRPMKGILSGQIKIFSPPTREGAGDGLDLTTRDVHLDRDRIYTTYEVDFRFGQSSGKGRDLKIALMPKQESKAVGNSSLGGVQSIELAHITHLHIASQGRGLLGDALESGGPAANAPAPLEVTCLGPLTFDVLSQLARLQDKVEVLRLNPGLAPDRLRCDELLLGFALQKPAISSEDEVQVKPVGLTTAGSPSAADDPLAGRLQRIIAIGRPAVLESPAKGLRAEAAWMEYSVTDRLITLKPDDEKQPNRKITQVSLQQLGQHFIAKQLQYNAAEQGHLGRLWAEGPGELRMLQGRGPIKQTIVARWDEKLSIQPNENNQVISLSGAASVTGGPLGRFDAKEIHLWVKEVRADQQQPVPPPMPQPLPQVAEPVAEDSGDKPSPVTIIPDRLLAIGNVRLASTQLDAECARLEAWFINVPLPAGQPRTEPPGSLPPLREPVQPASFTADVQPQGAIRDVIRPPNLQKFHVNGELIQMQLLVRGQKFDLENLTIDRHATIDEIRTPEPGQEPIHIVGDVVELRQGTTPGAIVKISGQPAEATGRGMSLAGGTIHIHRGENRMWIDGPGEATLPAPSGQSLDMGLPNAGGGTNPKPTRPLPPVPPVGPPQKIHIVWLAGLTFDGVTAKLNGDVRARTATQRSVSQTLEATLSQRIDFSATSGRQKPQLAKLHLDGGVFIENQGLDERGQQNSLDQMLVPQLTIDWTSGTLRGGPGWVSSVRRSAAGIPGAPARPDSQPLAPIRPPGTADDQPFTSIHVKFERAIEGNLARREVWFYDQVRTTYSPAREFTDRIVANATSSLNDLNPRGMLMTSEQLSVRDKLEPDRPRWVEMEATGHVIIDNVQFNVNAASVRYASDKELLVIEGSGSADAAVSYESSPGSPRSTARARKFNYWIKQGVFQGEAFSTSEFWLNGEMRLPRAPR